MARWSKAPPVVLLEANNDGRYNVKVLNENADGPAVIELGAIDSALVKPTNFTAAAISAKGEWWLSLTSPDTLIPNLASNIRLRVFAMLELLNPFMGETN